MFRNSGSATGHGNQGFSSQLAIGGRFSEPGYNQPLAQTSVISHEMGHVLGLYHTFNNISCNNGETDCFNQGDFVCDTPLDVEISQFDADPVTCERFTNAPCPAIIPDQDNNIMSYMPPTCLLNFTEGQGYQIRRFIAVDSEQFNGDDYLSDTIIECNDNCGTACIETGDWPQVGDTDGVAFTNSRIVTDCQGNIYLYGNIGGGWGAFQLAKYNKFGRQLWIKELPNEFETSGIDLKVDNDSNLYISRGTGSSFDIRYYEKYNTDGDLVNSVEVPFSTNSSQIEINKGTGDLFITNGSNPNYLSIQKMSDFDGNFETIGTINGTFGVNNLHLVHGTLNVFVNYTGTITFNNSQTFQNPNNTSNIILAQFNSQDDLTNIYEYSTPVIFDPISSPTYPNDVRLAKFFFDGYESQIFINNPRANSIKIMDLNGNLINNHVISEGNQNYPNWFYDEDDSTITAITDISTYTQDYAERYNIFKISNNSITSKKITEDFEVYSNNFSPNYRNDKNITKIG